MIYVLMFYGWMAAKIAQLIKAFPIAFSVGFGLAGLWEITLAGDPHRAQVIEWFHVFLVPPVFVQAVVWAFLVSWFLHLMAYWVHRNGLYAHVRFFEYLAREAAGFVVRATFYLGWSAFCTIAAHMLEELLGTWTTLVFLGGFFTVLVAEAWVAIVQYLGSEQRARLWIDRSKNVFRTLVKAKEEGVSEALDDLAKPKDPKK